MLREGLKRSTAGTNRVKLLLDLSYFYQRKVGEKAQDLDSAMLLARQALDLSRSLKFYKGEGMGHLMLAKLTITSLRGLHVGFVFE